MRLPTDPGRARPPREADGRRRAPLLAPLPAPYGGFLDWLEGLFAPDQPELGLRALVLDDVAPTLSSPQELRRARPWQPADDQ